MRSSGGDRDDVRRSRKACRWCIRVIQSAGKREVASWKTDSEKDGGEVLTVLCGELRPDRSRPAGIRRSDAGNYEVADRRRARRASGRLPSLVCLRDSRTTDAFRQFW